MLYIKGGVTLIKFNKLNPDEIRSKLPLLHDLFDKYSNKIAAAYLFGSFHNKNTTPLSDIDVAILFYNNIHKDEMNILESNIYEDLTQALKTDEIDLINLNTAPLNIQYGVLKSKEFLYCGDKDFIVDFESATILKYLDFQPYREEMDRLFLESIKGVKMNG